MTRAIAQLHHLHKHRLHLPRPGVCGLPRGDSPVPSRRPGSHQRASTLSLSVDVEQPGEAGKRMSSPTPRSHFLRPLVDGWGLFVDVSRVFSPPGCMYKGDFIGRCICAYLFASRETDWPTERTDPQCISRAPPRAKSQRFATDGCRASARVESSVPQNRVW